nr:MAG TPA: hypothetical protein [Caudoviricetes sp.]
MTLKILHFINTFQGLQITRARFRKAGFWLYQIHFSGFCVHKFRYFHCVFLSTSKIAVKLMSGYVHTQRKIHSTLYEHGDL